MKKTLLASSIIALTMTSASISFAADVGSGTIEFKGTVNTGACTIVPSSVNKEVQLGSVPVALLDTAGKQGPNTEFSLELQNCVLANPNDTDNDYSKVEVTFNGQMANADLWANSGSASNVGILFQDENGDNIMSGQSIEQSLSAGSNTINLSARMQALGAATAGSVKSTATYVLSYQ